MFVCLVSWCLCVSVCAFVCVHLCVLLSGAGWRGLLRDAHEAKGGSGVGGWCGDVLLGLFGYGSDREPCQEHINLSVCVSHTLSCQYNLTGDVGLVEETHGFDEAL